MASNRKLTPLIGGRVLIGVEADLTKVRLRFADGSVMTIEASGPTAGPTSGTVRAVRQAGTRFDLDFEGGQTLEIPLAEETSSVMLRDRNGAMEYAD